MTDHSEGEPTGEHDALHPEVMPPGYDTRASHGAYYDETYAMARSTTDSGAVMALVFSIASFFVCPLLPALAAVAMAPSAKRRIRHSNGALSGLGMAKAAQWLGWINIAVVVLLGWLIVRLVEAIANAIN